MRWSKNKNSKRSAKKLKNWINHNFVELKKVAESTTKYGILTSLESVVSGSDLYLRIGMSTGDAAGHNMTEKAAYAIAEYLHKVAPCKVELGSLSGNYCIDKKPAVLNIEKGRGKIVQAEIILPEDVVKKNLKTTSKRIVELNLKKNIIGSELAGSLGKNAHHANIVAAMYLATGQDIANVVGGSLGKTNADYLGGELRFSVKLPALIVGTIGGGTKQAYARENLIRMGCYGAGNPIGSNSKTLAEVIAATVLVGELSLMAALTNGDELMKTHLRFER